MGLQPPTIWPGHHLGAIDARAIVPVKDTHGGLTIFALGRPTHYLLDGEWYAAASTRETAPVVLAASCGGDTEDQSDGGDTPRPRA